MKSCDKFLWVEAYRPKSISECILPDSTKNTFLQFVENGDFGHLLMSGGPGTGKTTTARALCDDLDMDYMFINASSERNIDTVRNTIYSYASTVSLDGKRKCIILDEADFLNPNSAQPALRAVMEEMSNVRFILTCNYKNKIISPLHSRTTNIDFSLTNKDKEKMSAKFFSRVLEILKNEKVTFEKKVVAKIVFKHYPDARRILNDLQRFSSNGEISEEVLETLDSTKIEELMEFLKDRNFTKTREWVAKNSESDSQTLIRNLYDNVSSILKNESIPAFIMLLGEYQYKSAFVADQEINLMAFLTEILVSDMEFK